MRFHVKTPAEKIAELIQDLSQSDSGQFAQTLSSFCNRAKHSPANYQMLLQDTRQCMDQLRKVLLKEHAAELDKRGRKVSQQTPLVSALGCGAEVPPLTVTVYCSCSVLVSALAVQVV